MQRKLK